jgi:hypothetical protein
MLPSGTVLIAGGSDAEGIAGFASAELFQDTLATAQQAHTAAMPH